MDEHQKLKKEKKNEEILKIPPKKVPFHRWVGNATIQKYYANILYKNYHQSIKK
jgi:ribosomal protein L15E